ncbi:hypothetical protein DFJ73DRAFT_121974 [Zopfochytrium polystomum]|nr:hypothetical protein DFJ73DRAFT_121974 [Zopfochytrium polystomum]
MTQTPGYEGAVKISGLIIVNKHPKDILFPSSRAARAPPSGFRCSSESPASLRIPLRRGDLWEGVVAWFVATSIGPSTLLGCRATFLRFTRNTLGANRSLQHFPERFLVVEGYKQRPTEHSENGKSMGQAQFPPQGIWQVGTPAAAARHRNCRNGTVRSQGGTIQGAGSKVATTVTVTQLLLNSQTCSAVWRVRFDKPSMRRLMVYLQELTGSEVELAKILETPPHERRRPKAKDEWDRKYWSPVEVFVLLHSKKTSSLAAFRKEFIEVTNPFFYFTVLCIAKDSKMQHSRAPQGCFPSNEQVPAISLPYQPPSVDFALSCLQGESMQLHQQVMTTL